MFNPFYEQYIMHRRQDDFYNRHLLFRLIQKDARAQHTPYYKIPHGFEQLFIFLADKGVLLQVEEHLDNRVIAIINYPGVGYFNLDENPEKFMEYLQMF